MGGVRELDLPVSFLGARPPTAAGHDHIEGLLCKRKRWLSQLIGLPSPESDDKTFAIVDQTTGLLIALKPL
jgi:hypothetical protein